MAPAPRDERSHGACARVGGGHEQPRAHVTQAAPRRAVAAVRRFVPGGAEDGVARFASDKQRRGHARDRRGVWDGRAPREIRRLMVVLAAVGVVLVLTGPMLWFEDEVPVHWAMLSSRSQGELDVAHAHARECAVDARWRHLRSLCAVRQVAAEPEAHMICIAEHRKDTALRRRRLRPEGNRVRDVACHHEWPGAGGGVLGHERLLRLNERSDHSVAGPPAVS